MLKKEKQTRKVGRPKVITAQAMVSFQRNEDEIFTKWRTSKILSPAEKELLRTDSVNPGISEGLRLLMLQGINKDNLRNKRKGI